MDLSALLARRGEWLRGTGPEADIVVSSRLRLARNLAEFPFASRASVFDKREIDAQLRAAADGLALGFPLHYFDVSRLPPLDRQLLVERHLISREHAQGDGTRGAAISAGEDVSLMFNEEDHLRIQVIRSGFALRQGWELVDRIDDAIESRVRYAFSEEFGYLTACPTNVGTGIRASVMLHLPALAMTKQIEKVFRALQKIQLAVRGLYGEGSQASGDFYQISNNVTLGRSELDLVANIEAVVPQIVDIERRARREMAADKPELLSQRVANSLEALSTATTISSEEAMYHLSYVRMGVNLNLLDRVGIEQVNDLFLRTQPAHLQKLEGRDLDLAKGNQARAAYLRRQLDGG